MCGFLYASRVLAKLKDSFATRSHVAREPPAQYSSRKQTLCSSLHQMLAGHIQRFENRLGLVHRQRNELFQLSSKSNNMLDELSNTLLEDKKHYMQIVNKVRGCQQTIQARAQELNQIIGTNRIDELVDQDSEFIAYRYPSNDQRLDLVR